MSQAVASTRGKTAHSLELKNLKLQHKKAATKVDDVGIAVLFDG